MKHMMMMLVMGLLFVRGTSVLVAQSDSEIKQNFETRFSELLKSAEAATTTAEIKKVQSDIDAFEKEYAPHKEFLDKALYPDDFTKSLENLRSRVSYTARQTEAVETQSARATELEGQVKTLTEQVDKLTSENSSILEQLHALEADRTKDRKQIEQLRGLVAKLQKNIADRDNMIFNLADSLFLQFDKPTMTPADERQKMIAFEKNNILSSVKRAINDNMTFLQSTTLSGEEVVKLKDEQKKFA
jgi:peptidoglycan hydrolase CwlO-like protein